MGAVDLLFDSNLSSERLHQIVLVTLLQRTDLLSRLGFGGNPAKVVWEPHGGLFDLAVQLGEGETKRTLWIEVKVDATLPSKQTDEQIAFLQRQPPRDEMLYLALGIAAATSGAITVQTRIRDEIPGRGVFITREPLIQALTDAALAPGAERRDEVLSLRDAYLRALDQLGRRMEAFANKSPALWNDFDRIGFLIAWKERCPQSRRAIGVDVVPNPRGGFRCANWQWTPVSGGELYLQVELPSDGSAGALVARVYVTADERSQRARIRDAASRAVLEAASSLSIVAQRPRWFGSGRTMRVAVFGAPLAGMSLRWEDIDNLCSSASQVMDAAAARLA